MANTSRRSNPETTGDLSPSTKPRQRGRPRLHASDQTARERRRTQIRLAQRAYRERKETTIASLNRRIISLERTIHQTQRSFLSFQAENPNIDGLHRFGEILNTLSTNAAHPYENDDERLERNLNEDDPDDVLESEDLGLPERPDLSMDPILEQVDVPQMQDRSLPEATHSSTYPDLQPYQLQVQQDQDLVGPPSFDVSQPSPAQVLSICPGLPLPKSYAHTETSFTRRLMRSCLESTIQMLCSPSSDPRQAYQLGRFTILYADGPRILSCLMDLASRAVNQNLELWQVPIYHHGGAGLHFPRIGIDVSSQPPENWAAAGPMGPEVPSDSDVPPAWKQPQIIEQLEMDGEWFDSNDVEQYLRTKGIFLDGISSVVEISEPTSEASEASNIPDLAPTAVPYGAGYPTNNIPSSYSGLEHPKKNTFTPSNGMVFGNETLFYSYPVGYDMMALDIEMEDVLRRFDNDININVDSNVSKDGYGYGYGYDDSSSIPPPFTTKDLPSTINTTANFPEETEDPLFSTPYYNPYPQEFHPYQTQTQAASPPLPLFKRKKYLNVDRLIQLIFTNSVCLGRTPGFRRKYIDQALGDVMWEEEELD